MCIFELFPLPIFILVHFFWMFMSFIGVFLISHTQLFEKIFNTYRKRKIIFWSVFIVPELTLLIILVCLIHEAIVGLKDVYRDFIKSEV